MELSEIKTLLEGTGLPVAYRMWPEGAAPALPYLVYFETSNNNFAADGIVYHRVPGIAIELYTEKKEPETECLVEDALSEFFWTKEETYIDSEHFYEVRYEIQV